MYEWIVNNKEILFGGAGVAIIGGLITWIRRKSSSEPEVVTQNSTTSIGGFGSGPTVVIKGSVSAGGDISIGNVTEALKETVSKSAFDRFQSELKKDRGREKVQEWGAKLSEGKGWDWHLLGQALEHYADAIKLDPTHQHPWTNIAFVFHLIGLKKNADTCLNESFRLASPGQNHPGNNYKQVHRAVETDSYLGGGRVDRPSMPSWFKEKFRRYMDASMLKH